MCLRKVRTWFAHRPAPQRLLLLIGLLSAGILGVALISQYGFGLHPCDLCIKQRIPYAILIVLGLAGGLFVRSRRVALGLGWLSFLLLLVESGIAWYHAGVEKGIFKGPDACSGGSKPGDSLEELRRQIMEAPLVSCNQAAFEWQGLSMAGWNGVVSLVLALAVFMLLLRMRTSPR